MSDIELIKAEIERMHQQAVLAACGNPTDWLRSRIGTCVDILAFIDSLPEETCKESLQVQETCKDSFTDDLEKAADKYSEKHGFRVPYDGSDNFYNAADVKASKEGFIAGAEWMRSRMPMPEDTVIFMKGVAEGRRLEREERNDDNLPRFYGD